MTTAISSPLLRAKGIAAALGGREVLRDVTLDVASGEVVGLLGPNGAGKSTFLRAVTALIPLTAGSVEVFGATLANLDRRALARGVAVVQQLPEAPPEMSVEDLVLLGRTPHLGLLGRESARDFAVTSEAMRRAGCEDLASRPLGTLSGGQRRRVFIARALAQEPRLLLLDEPTANLDVQAQYETFELLRALAADGVGVLVVVHDMTLAAAYCDRLVLLADGRVVASGPPAAVVTVDIIRSVYGNNVTVLAHPGTAFPIVVPVMVEEPHD